MIEIRNLVKKYGDKVAVDGLNLSIREGELFVLLGPNAAGKTTTLKLLAGLLKPTAGQIRVGDYDVVAEYEKAKKQIRFVPDFPFLYGKLSGMEFLEFVGDLYGVDRKTLASESERLLGLFDIWEDRDGLIEDYSHGMKQKLIMTATFLVRPPAVVIDEPMVGLDPASAQVFKRLLKEHTRQGGTVLLSTHTLSVAEEVADRIGILHRGQLIACGSLGQLRAQAGGIQELEELFLALTRDHEDLPRKEARGSAG